ncbi:MAG: ribosomal protein [Pseudomonadota bacterium]|jgi:large subunit ribosomal protein L25
MATHAIYELEATLRDDKGKGASRRLRRQQDQFPAIIYGGSQKPMQIQLDQKKMLHALSHEGFYSHILTLSVEGKKQNVILKALQRHHYKKSILHADFMRVSATDKVHIRIPLHFINAENCPGAKEGGVINHQAVDVDIRCQANKLPEFIEVDLSNLGLDESIHLSQLHVDPSVELVALAHGNDMSVVSVHLPRVVAEDIEPVVETEAPVEATDTQTAPDATTEEKTDGKHDKKDKH